MAIIHIEKKQKGCGIRNNPAELIITVYFSDKEKNEKTFSFSFSNETRNKCFGNSKFAHFAYDTDAPGIIYFCKGDKNNYMLNQRNANATRSYVCPSRLYDVINQTGLINVNKFIGQYMVEYSKEHDMFFINCEKKI